MKGDFSRSTFNRAKHYTRLLMQQGRVHLDADWNEQADIQAYFLRSLAMDLIGAHGGPVDNCGFEISAPANSGHNGISKPDLPRAGDFVVGRGRYYVNGILCENESDCLFSKQPYASPSLLKVGRYLIYLDVWERHITHLEDPSLREVALGGPDTTTRLQVVWTAKARQLDLGEPYLPAFLKKFYWRAWLRRTWKKWLGTLDPDQHGYLKVRCESPVAEALASLSHSSAGGYQGLENHLYRVEIHTSSLDQPGVPAGATFKWSRENGSVVVPIINMKANSTSNTTDIFIRHDHLGRSLELFEGDWVEIVDDDSVLQGIAEPLHTVISFDQEQMCVTVAGQPYSGTGKDSGKRPLLRRWDQKEDQLGGGGDFIEGAVRLVEKEAENENWLPLEQGILVQFQPGGLYRTGDYWQFPARTETRNVEWPAEPDELGNPTPLAQPPGGIHHHFAPLAILSVHRNGKLDITDLRRTFGLIR